MTSSSSKPWVLAIETSNPSSAPEDTTEGATEDWAYGPGVAAGWAIGETPFDTEPLAPTARHDDDLMPAIDRLATRNGLSPRAISAVAVSIGPGGYTGLRIAVVTAKALALSCGAETYAVPTAAIAGLGVDAPMLVLLASKRDTVWAAIATPGEEPEPIGTLDAAQIRSLMDERGIGRAIGDRFVPDALREVVPEWVPPKLGPVRCLEATRPGHRVDPLRLAPMYAREPEAVRKWRELGRG
ncbi:MAG: tRNA (adenosine(37)-N6)-threonylcarbamoyltransferase complex dimerization subunit type 1 TsaB [Planctomycetota bacterium]